MLKVYKDDPLKVSDLDDYFQTFILPEFGNFASVEWQDHMQTHPDNFIHIFMSGGKKYVLAFDDYPSGFSIEGDTSVEVIGLSDEENFLHVITQSDKYAENVTGYFMLFSVVNATQFDTTIAYLRASYEQLQRKWISESKHTVLVARDVLYLAETAAKNNDSRALYSLRNIIDLLASTDAEDTDVPLDLLRTYLDHIDDTDEGYQTYTKEEKEQAAADVYSRLSKEVSDTLTIQKYNTAHPGGTVKLVSAMYVKTTNTTTEGISIRILLSDDDIQYPTDHFINDALRHYFEQNPQINRHNIAHNMPDTLQDYRLVEGSLYDREVLLRELAYIAY